MDRIRRDDEPNRECYQRDPDEDWDEEEEPPNDVDEELRGARLLLLVFDSARGPL